MVHFVLFQNNWYWLLHIINIILVEEVPCGKTGVGQTCDPVQSEGTFKMMTIAAAVIIFYAIHHWINKSICRNHPVPSHEKLPDTESQSL